MPILLKTTHLASSTALTRYFSILLTASSLSCFTEMKIFSLTGRSKFSLLKNPNFKSTNFYLCNVSRTIHYGTFSKTEQRNYIRYKTNIMQHKIDLGIIVHYNNNHNHLVTFYTRQLTRYVYLQFFLSILRQLLFRINIPTLFVAFFSSVSSDSLTPSVV